MQKNKSMPFSFAVAVCLLAASVLAGCSQGDQDAANAKLLDAMAKAQKFQDKALNQLSGNVYAKGDDYGPTPIRENDLDQVTVLPEGSIHPEVLDNLKKGASELSQAISANRAASPELLATAEGLLAEIATLQGYCYETQLRQLAGQLQDARYQSNKKLTVISLQAGLGEYYAQLGAVDKEQIRQLSEEAEALLARKNNELAQLDSQIAEVQAQKANAASEYESSAGKSRIMIADAQNLSGQEGMDKLEEGLELQARANAAEQQMAQAEFRLSMLQNQRQVLEVDLSATQARIDAMAQILKEREPQMRDNQVSAQASENRLSGSVESVEQDLARVATLADQVGNVYGLALESYRQAETELNKARRSAGQFDVNSQSGSVGMSLAGVQIFGMQVKTANDLFVARVEEVWKQLKTAENPAALAKINASLPDLEVMKAGAIESYTQAADAYEKAAQSRNISRELRWAYQGQIGTAYQMLHVLNGDPQALAKAQENYDAALEGRQFSEYLSTVAELRAMLGTAPKQP